MKGPKFITISGYGWKAIVCPSIGMNTISLSVNEQPIFHTPDCLDTVSVSYTSNGNQLLFPPNRTAGAKFTFDGHTYYLSNNEPRFRNHLHGRLKSSEFRVKTKSAHHVCAEYTNIGELYPFPFQLTVKCSIEHDGYHQSFTFQNIGKCDMPLVFGLHTNFEVPNNFSVPLGAKWVTNENYIPTGELKALSDTEKNYCTGSKSKGFPISGFFTSAGKTATVDNILYTVSDNFDQWILYNSDGNKGFLSIEPQCGAVNALNSGVGLHRLQPGQTETFHTWIHLAEENPN